jgi:type VI secretion system secreted protein VgrG
LAKRAICTQYQESDLDFLSRLLASEGLSYRFEHDQPGDSRGAAASAGPGGSNNGQAHARHCLVIFDSAASVSQWPAVSPSSALSAIRFHRAAATEKLDTITAFSAQRQAGANAVALSSWDHQQLLAPSAEVASGLNAGALPVLTQYDGAGQRRYANGASAQQIAQLRLAALELPHKIFQGAGSARQMSAGARFTLTQHDHYSGEAREFKLLWVEHAAANNLPAQVSALLQRLGSAVKPGLGAKSASSPMNTGASSYQNSSNDDSEDLSQLERGTYGNRFGAVRQAVPVVPLATSTPAEAVASGPQTALVVGLLGERLSTERNHAVQVQFAWQRGAKPNAGGLTDTGADTGADTDTQGNAPCSDASGTWVRVAEALAGPNWGTQFTPRIGTEVLVDFIDADMDQPLVVAQLYNGVDTPPFAAGVDSGVNHGGVLSGWHSHGLTGSEGTGGGEAGAGGGYNQWVLDDTCGQLRMRLASSSAASQLSTGYLIGQSPASSQRGSYRGSGFELRTDAWGVVRAPQGLLLSSTARSQTGSSVAGTQMDTLEARAQLKGAQSLTDALTEAAQHQGAVGAGQVKDAALAQKTLLVRLDPKEKGSFKGQGLSSLNGQATQKAQAGSRELDAAPESAVERFGAPLIVVESPSSLVLVSAASTALFAGEQLHLVTQGDAHYGAAHTVSSVAGRAQTWFTHAGGLEAVAANGPLSLQAHTDQLELLADKEVTVVSVNDGISINAKTKIVLKAGQTSITLEGSNITFACPGTFSVKGSGHSLAGGASAAANLKALPDEKAKDPEHWIGLDYRDPDTGGGIDGAGYAIHFEGGKVLSGKLDAQGRAEHEGIDPRQVKKVIYKPREPGQDKPHAPLEELLG